jgi:hypothetical protein
MGGAEKKTMTANLIVGFGGVGLLGMIAFLWSLREIRREEARRRANRAQE